MNNTIDNIRKTIFQFALEENTELEKVCKYGIFHMPELAFAYKCGKVITENRQTIFNGRDYIWLREREYKNYGIADMVFEPCDKKNPELVFEFKMDNTWNEYLRDIKKLISLTDNNVGIFRKYFCAQKWVINKNQGEEFMNILYKEFPSGKVQLLFNDYFDTYITPSKKEGSLFSFWEVF